MWLGLLYCIMCLGAVYYVRSGDDLPEPYCSPQDLVSMYRENAVQCLILADDTKALPYSVETLFLYMSIEYYRSSDAQLGVWLIFGIIVRLAMPNGLPPRRTTLPGHLDLSWRDAPKSLGNHCAG
jgi:hypothetical protein